MKPFPASPWTLEDAMVWRRFELTIGDLAVWRYVHADRCDALLMDVLGTFLWRRRDCISMNAYYKQRTALGLVLARHSPDIAYFA